MCLYLSLNERAVSGALYARVTSCLGIHFADLFQKPAEAVCGTGRQSDGNNGVFIGE